MKLLFDQNMSFRLAKKLASDFPGCQHVSDCGLRNATDVEIWQYAKKEHFSIVTYDADFFEISLIEGHPPKIIWLRVGNLSTNQLVALLFKHRTAIEGFLNEPISSSDACLEITSLSAR